MTLQITTGVNFFVKDAGRPSLLIDIGGNYGYYTTFARALGCRVLTLEPVPQYVRVIRKQMAANGFPSNVEPRVRIVQALASDEPDVQYTVRVPNASLDVHHGMAGMDGPNGLIKGYPWQQSSPLRVKTVLIDDLVPQGTDVCLLKCGVEGYEAQAILGARKLLSSRSVRSLMFELTKPSSLVGGTRSSDRANRQARTNVEMLRLLRSVGFTIRHLPNRVLMRNISRPKHTKSWSAARVFRDLEPFPTQRACERLRASGRGDEPLLAAYEHDIRSLSTNLIARLDATKEAAAAPCAE